MESYIQQIATRKDDVEAVETTGNTFKTPKFALQIQQNEDGESKVIHRLFKHQDSIVYSLYRQLHYSFKHPFKLTIVLFQPTSVEKAVEGARQTNPFYSAVVIKS